MENQPVKMKLSARRSAFDCGFVNSSARAAWVVLLAMCLQAGASPQEYRFFYNFAPGRSFFETSQSRQTSGGKVISQFREVAQYDVSGEPGAPTATLSARIVFLSNEGRRIDYYDGVTFTAKISATGEVSEYSFSGGQPRYRALMEAAAIRSKIFWMPVFPETPLRVGDSFSHVVSIPGVQARMEYELESIRDLTARFRVRRSSSMSLVGAESSEGTAVFDMAKAMWTSLSLSGEGTVHLPVSVSYKSTSSKQVANHGGCDQPTTGVNDAANQINNAGSLADTLMDTVLSDWPGSGQDLYASYRHFHCPNNQSHLPRIRQHLVDARRIAGEFLFICLPVSNSLCGPAHGSDPAHIVGPATGASAAARRLVQLCPDFFQLQDDGQAAILIAAAAEVSGVSRSHRIKINQPGYYDFMVSADEIINGNPNAYAYLALERSGWTLPAPARLPCFPGTSGQHIGVRGGNAATDPAAVRHGEGTFYEIFSDPATGDRFIRHNNLRGTEFYLHGEARRRYYLPP